MTVTDFCGKRFWFAAWLLFSCSTADARSVYQPRYDEQQLHSQFKDWVATLDTPSLAVAYPEVVRKLLSADRDKQLEAIRTLGASVDIRAIPWLLPWLDSPDPVLRIWAGSSIGKITSDLVYREPRNPAVRAAELQALAWLVLQMLKAPDDGNTRGYAATMAGLLRLHQFEAELRRCTSSVHPAVANSAIATLEALASEPVKNLGK